MKVRQHMNYKNFFVLIEVKGNNMQATHAQRMKTVTLKKQITVDCNPIFLFGGKIKFNTP